MARTPFQSPPTIGRYAKITIDKAFKLIFSQEANKGLLIQMLNMLIPGKDIQDIVYHDKEKHGFDISDKSTTFDLYCKTSDERDTFIVEMQSTPQAYFKDRVLFYSTYPVREQIIERSKALQENDRTRLKKFLRLLRLRRNVSSYMLLPVYMVSIVDFVMPHPDRSVLEEGLVSRYSIWSDNGDERMTDAIHFVFFEIGRMHYGIHEPGRCKTILEKTAFAFRYMQDLAECPPEFQEAFLKELFKASEVAQMTPKQKRTYDKTIMTTEIDKRAQLAYAREEAKKEAKKEDARAMLVKGLDISLITEVTGLTEKEILQDDCDNRD